jgi:hypothetical protein
MRHTLGWALALLVLGPPLAAREAPKDEPGKKSPAQQYQAIIQEYNQAQSDFNRAYTAAKTDAERQKAIQEKYPQADKYADRFLKLAEDNPKDPAAFDALTWVVTRAGYGNEGARAMDLLLKDHVESPKLAQVCQSLRYNQSPAAEKLLRGVMEKNPSHEVKGQATYSLAFSLHRQAARAANPNDADKVRQESEALFDQVIKDYADVKSFRGTLADAARGDLFEMHNLAIGKAAPEIEGEDLDGKKFKLSDYRGKVVVLDFWGNW